MVKQVILITALLALGACSTTKTGNFCDIAQPLRPSPATVSALTDAEVAEMLKHNERGKALCGWRA